MLAAIKKFFKDKKNRRNLIIYTIIFFSIFVFFSKDKINKKDNVSITEFVQQMEDGNPEKIKKIFVSEDSQVFTYTVKGEKHTVDYPYNFLTQNEDFMNSLVKNKVKIEFKANTLLAFTTFMQTAFTFLLLGFILYMFRSMFSGSFTTIEEVKNEKVTFKDIAGYHYVKEELKEIVDFLHNASNYEKYTNKLPKGILLEGPPGNGKTLFAKAIAGESNTPFFHFSASDIEDKYVGSGAQKLDRIFKIIKKRAKESGKAILFIDEIDAVGLKREKRTVVETNQTINKLLTELDGFDKDTNIMVIAATNLASMLDTALTRSGRFDRTIQIPKPNLKDREEVIKLYLGRKKDILHEEVEKENYSYTLAQQTAGFCNADIDTLINEASLIAKKEKKEKIDIKCLREGFTKIVAGLKTEHALSEEDRKIIAYHEAGHATALLLTSPKKYKSIAYITITPYGQSLGHVAQANDTQVLVKKSALENQIKMTLAGRAVEEKILNGDYTTGAASDLQQANEMILGYISKFGMSEGEQNLFIEQVDENKNVIQKESKILRERLYTETKELIESHFDIVEKIAEHLLQHESIEQYELELLLEDTSANEKNN